ncbi:hypothetical protein RJ639_024841 [Escallonia herrerae]|uniref:Uncharacterized protein n=1 Tax=Escallonia herrerae TaxID=1293975 RepID=A0AA88UXC3_9ASTE|nr:hypothetical protein RJ639_024841 [Escallonia herrerae]
MAMQYPVSVVPYHRNSIVKYQAHINIEWCNRAKSIKYLFKYITKGPDRATMVIEKANGTSTSRKDERSVTVDEVKHYQDCRYISASEACWRIFEFPIHFREPTVQRLSFHLENEQPITFEESESLDGVMDRIDPKGTMFMQWMETNKRDRRARSLTYSTDCYMNS